MKECVVVLGMHRSGTSVLTGLLSILGCYTGFDLMKPTEDNPKGYFENNKIYMLNKKILEENNASWDDYNFILNNISVEKYKVYVKEAKKVLEEELKYVEKTVIKDPRLCVLFPIWKQALNDLGIQIKIIFAYRNPLEVAYSLKQRDAIPLEKGIMLWSHYFFQAEKHSRGYARIIVKYNDDFMNMEKLLDYLGGFLTTNITKEMGNDANDLYSPKLKHHHLQFNNISNDIPPYLLKIIKMLEKEGIGGKDKIEAISRIFYRDKNYYLYDEKSLYKIIKDYKKSEEQLHEKIEVANKKTEIANKKTEIANKKTEIANKNTEVANKKTGNITSKLESEIERLLSEIDKKNKEIKNQIINTQQQFTDYKKQLHSLQSSLEVGNKILKAVLRKKKTRKVLIGNINIGKIPLKIKKWGYLFSKGTSKKSLREKHFIVKSKLFSPFYYLTTYAHLWEANVDPIEHFCRYGWKEGRNPSALFDTRAYLNANQDVAKYKINPLLHYIQHGKQEGREIFSVDHEGKHLKKMPSFSPPSIVEHKGEKKHQADQLTVLLVSHNVSKTVYGGERSFIDMLKAAVRSEINVIIALPKAHQQTIDILKQYAVTVLVFHYGWWKKNTPVSEVAINNFSFVIKKHAINLVHVNTIMLREPLIAAKKLNIPSITHIRELITGDETLTKIIGKSATEIVDDINVSSEYIIANSKATSEAYGDAKKITVIHNTVDTDQFDIENKLESTLSVALVSSNIEKKGIFELLEIAENCRIINNVAFLLIGPETSEVASIKEQIAIKKLKNLKIVGYKESSLEAIASANIILNISKFTESFGRTVLEGMAARRPVIAYEWGAVSELIVDNKTGYLVPYLDINAVVEKIKYLNTHRELISTMGEKGRARAIKYFSLDTYVAKVKQCYANILTKKQINLHQRETSQQRIAYFLWFFPVPSETFVLNELRVLVKEGYDVIVFCKQSPYPKFTPDFEIPWDKVSSPKQLAEKLLSTKRTIVHSHFTYPTVTDMVWPACEQAKIDFSFIAHAQDIFRYSNIEKNRIDEISRSPFCKKVLIPSRFHRDYVIEQGVLAQKTFINPNGIDPTLYEKNRERTNVKPFTYRVCAIHRYTEKKGLENLILSSKHLVNKQLEIHIYGYGDLEESYKALVEAHQLDRVYIHGMVQSREEMLTIFSQNDAFLCPSVRAKDGDMDGIPTVLMEAMAYGIPVISTRLSGILDLISDQQTGFITEANPESIAMTINTFYAMPPQQIAVIVKSAKNIIYKKYNSVKLVNSLVRIWSSQKSLDIIIVSWNNLPELKEVIQRLQKYTLSRYNLIISDNNSEPDVKGYLDTLTNNNITVVFNNDNLMVGPASNIAIERGNSEYIIYVCGKEGFVFDYQWEVPFIDTMDEQPQVGLAGTLCYSPSYLTGKDYPNGIALFEQFRNQPFALENPERRFKHVQGGFFVIRRKMYQQIGGFSEAVKHQYTDVEYSYYAESCGWELGSVEGILSLYNKSRPTIFSRLDESIKAIHPPTLKQLPLLDKISQSKLNFCNLCEWQGKQFNKHQQCPSCDSLPDDRSLYRYLATSSLTYQRLVAISIGLPNALKNFWGQQFQGEMFSARQYEAQINKKGKLSYSDHSLALFYYNAPQLDQAVLEEAKRLLNKKEGHFLIQQITSSEQNNDLDSVIMTLSQYDFKFLQEIHYNSAVLQYGWNNFWLFKCKGN
jgi:glycosyltransferase involved in cell wall biosynthesis